MAKRHADITILCEDRAHANFVRHYLKKRGFNNRQLRPVPWDGSGSGQQFVLQKYATEVKAYRSQANHLSLGLITVIDADRQEVRNVQQRLERQLQDANIENREADEHIALLVPKRNIETWIVYLQGTPVDEESEYKQHSLAKNYKQAGITLDEQLGQQPRADCPQSLQMARDELKHRLPG